MFVDLYVCNIAFTSMSLLHLCHILLSLLTTIAKNLFDECESHYPEEEYHPESHTQKIIFRELYCYFHDLRFRTILLLLLSHFTADSV